MTPEAVKPLFEKEIDGFSALFHLVSFKSIGTSTVQSRACGGMAKNGTLIFSLPGSPGACKDGWNGILKLQLDNRHRPCSFIEVMPRLKGMPGDEIQALAGCDEALEVSTRGAVILLGIDIAERCRKGDAPPFEIAQRVGKRMRARPAHAAKGESMRGERRKPTSQ